MEEYEIIALVRQIIRQELAPIVMATIDKNASTTRTSAKRFANDNTLPNLRNISPYGVSSRAPSGTQCVMTPINSDPTHINITGYFDENRPTVQDGEACLYNQYGQLVYLKNGKIQIGSKSADEPFVLGNVFKTMMNTILDAIVAHTHVTASPGAATTPPVNSAAFTAVKADPLATGRVLSQTIFGEYL